MPAARQIREACALLGWSRHDLQRTTALSSGVVDLLLAANDGTEITLDQEVVVGDALLRAGVEFIPERDGDPGVRLSRGDPPIERTGR